MFRLTDVFLALWGYCYIIFGPVEKCLFFFPWDTICINNLGTCAFLQFWRVLHYSFTIWIYTSICGRPGVLISHRRFLTRWLFSCTWLWEESTFSSPPYTGPWVSSPLLFHLSHTALALQRMSGCGFTVGHPASTSSLFRIRRWPQHKSSLMPGLFLRLPGSSGSWTNNYSLPWVPWADDFYTLSRLPALIRCDSRQSGGMLKI